MGNLVVFLIATQLIVSSLLADDRKTSNVNNKDFSNQTALHDAVRTKKLDMVKFLVQSKTKLDTKDQFGYTPLHLAVRYTDLNTTNYLIENNATIDSVDGYGETPLVDAVRSNNTEIAKALICAKANRDVEDQYDVTPIHYATKNQNLYLLKLLSVDYVELYCQGNIDISIDQEESSEDKISKVCGKIDTGYASFMSLSFVSEDMEEFGPYKVDIDNENHTWCSKVQDELPLSNYTITAKANDFVVNEAIAEAKRFVLSDSNSSNEDNKTIEIKIDEIIEPINTATPQICGSIEFAFAKKVNLSVSPENNETKILGEYEALVENEDKRWCADITAPLAEGNYTFSALGEDEKGNISKDKTSAMIKLAELFDNNISIDIDPITIYNDNTPTICGRVLSGDVSKLDLVMISKDGIESNIYEADIDQEKQTWCADVTDELENGTYTIKATAYDENENQAVAEQSTKLYRIIGLYEALNEEFKDDFSTWNAELDKDTLTFRFKDPTLLFNPGRSNIKERFAQILSDFFPRYVKIVEEYKLEIDKVRIEGHSSSEHSRASNDDERFALNQELSQNRAESVLDNAKALDNEIIQTNAQWIDNTFEPVGMSYSKLIYNLDGSENKELSRRVELRIVTKILSDTSMIDGKAPTPDLIEELVQ